MKQIILIVVTILLFGCIKGTPDNGTKLINSHGYYVKPITFPVRVSVKDDHLKDDVLYSIEWWHDKLYEHWLVYCEHHVWARCNKFPKFIVYVDHSEIVSVFENPVNGQDYNGKATTWSLVGGALYSADVELVRGRWNLDILSHELGHAVFGLDHDDGDISSIMHPHVSIEEYKLTYEDAELIFRDYLLVRSSFR